MADTPNVCGSTDTSTGKPCQRRVSGPDERCPDHPDRGGRPPTVLTDEQIEQVETLAQVLNQQQIADFFGISDRTFRRLLQRDERVSSAYKKGRAQAVANVGKGLLQRATEGDNTAAIFYLKTQAGWKETQRLEVNPEEALAGLLGVDPAELPESDR